MKNCVAMLIALLIAVTWWTGSPLFKVDSSKVPTPVFTLSDLAPQWQTQRTENPASDAVSITDSSVILTLSDEHAGPNTTAQKAVATVQLPINLQPPFAGAQLLASATVNRLSPVTAFFRLLDSPLVYIALRDAQQLYDYMLIHRSAGLHKQESTHALWEPDQRVQSLQIGWRVTRPGVWQLSDLSLSWVAPFKGYEQVRVAIGFAWIMLVLVCAAVLVRQLDIKHVLVLGGVVCGLVFFIVIGQSLFAQFLTSFQQTFTGWLPQSLLTSSFLLQKMGHVAAFFAVTVLLCLYRTRLGLTTLAACTGLVLLAFGTEALQRHIPQRHASLTDVVIDLAGVVLGYIVFKLFTLLASFRKEST